MVKKILSLSIVMCMVSGLVAEVNIGYTDCSANESISQTNRVIAFPGAEGGGMYATGARAALENGSNIEVYHVTNTNDRGEGSFRDAVSKGNRIIVFDVAGNIQLDSSINISKNNLTILGQTAPGDGVCFSGNNIKVSGENIILRYLRFRVGSKLKDGSYTRAQDGLEITDNTRNVIIDHCSISWGTDENLSAYAVKDVTIQWSIIAEALNQSIHAKGEHGYAGIWGGVNLTVHHNLIATHKSRNPKIGTSETVAMTAGYRDDETVVDIRNNVIYNWGDKAGYGAENGAEVNIVNNYYKPGPATPAGKRSRIFELSPGNKYQPNWSGKIYASGNYIDVDSNDSDKTNADLVNKNNWQVERRTGVYLDASNPSYVKLDAPNTTYLKDYPIVTQTAQEAYQAVLNGAGARLPKLDVVDQRIINNVINRTAPMGSNGSVGLVDDPTDGSKGAPEGIYNEYGYPEYSYDPSSIPTDTDRDGIPDIWEDRMGLNKLNPNDSVNIGPDGYTWLEIYVEEAITKPSANSETLPKVELISPANDQVVDGSVLLSAGVTGSNITKVDFYSNDKLIATAENGVDGIYTATASNLEKGVQYITAKAYNSSGEYTISKANIVYVSGNGDVSPWTGIGAVYENGKYYLGSSMESNIGKMTQIISGDFDFIAEIDDIPNINNNVPSGIFAAAGSRDTDESVLISKHYDNYRKTIQISTDKGATFTTVAGSDFEKDNLLKISRTGGTLTFYTASGLSSWNLVKTVDISSWPDSIIVGAMSGSTNLKNVARFNKLKLITSSDKTSPSVSIVNVTDQQRLGFKESLEVQVVPDNKAKVSEIEVYLNGTLLTTYKSQNGISNTATISIPVSFDKVAYGILKVVCYDENLGVAEDSVTVSISADITPWIVENVGGDSDTLSAYVYCTNDYTYKLYAPEGQIGGTSDTYGYMYQQFKDDTRLYYRSRMQGSTSFGVMLKDNLDADGISYFFGGEYVNGKLVYRLKARETKGGKYSVKATIDHLTSATYYFVVEKVGKKLNIYQTEYGQTVYKTKTLLASVDTVLGDRYYMGYAATGGVSNPADAGWVSIENIPAGGGNSLGYNLNYGLDWSWQVQEPNVLTPSWTTDELVGNSTGKMVLSNDENYVSERYVMREYVMPDNIILEGGFKILLTGENPGLNAYLQTQGGAKAFKVTFANGVISVNNEVLTDDSGKEITYSPYKWYKATILTNMQIDPSKADIAIYEAESYNSNYTLLATVKAVPSSSFRVVTHVKTEQPIQQGVYFEPVAGFKGTYYIDDVYVYERLDKDMLLQIVNQASEYDETQYTPESFIVLRKAIDHANTVLSQETPTAEEISRSIKSIQNALAQLQAYGEWVLTSSTIWKFDQGAFKGITSTTQNTSYDGLIVSDVKEIQAVSSVSIDGESFTSRLKIGTGSISSSYVKFNVSGYAVITVYGEPAGSTGVRCVTINDGVAHTTQLTGKMSVTYIYTGLTPKTIYIYGTTGGINLYGIKVEEYSPITASTNSKIVYYDEQTGVVTVYKGDDTTEIALVAASYTENGSLADIKVLRSSLTVEKGRMQDFVLGKVAGNNVKIFLWDSLNQLKPFTGVFK